jgi:hypothetical protein
MSEVTFPPAPDVAGASLDGTKIFTITAEENADLCRSTGVEPAADGSAHPIYYYIATQVAMGKTVAGVCETCEFDVDDGPMMGSSGVKFTEALMVGQSYKVTGGNTQPRAQGEPQAWHNGCAHISAAPPQRSRWQLHTRNR